MAVHVRRETPCPEVSLARLKRTAQRILNYLGEESSELSLLLVGNRKIRSLNAKFRGKDTPTDVLSFPLEERLPTGIRLLGDVVISLEQAKIQAREKRKDFAHEVEWLLIHGILHLLGYDHERSRKDDRIMRSLERRIQRALSGKRS
jgi:probable rRNA maturation factor